jgi:hypothetical protein
VLKLFPVTWSKWNRTCSVAIILYLSWLISHAHFVQNQSEGPHVNFRSNQLVVTLDLGGNVTSCARSHLHKSFAMALVIHKHGNAKVTNFNNWFFSSLLLILVRSMKENIGEFHVCMDDVAAMDFNKSLQYVSSILFYLVLIFYFSMPNFQFILEVFGIVYALHKYYNLVVVFGVVEQPDNIIVVKVLLDSTLLPCMVELLVAKQLTLHNGLLDKESLYKLESV